MLAAACLALPAFAQDPGQVTQTQFDDAYQQLLKNPQDQTLLINYANIGIRLKNYEAVIPPLESMLMSNPDDADLKVKIGSLYQLLGSTLMAKHYFEDAVDTPDASQETIDQAKERLRGL